MLQDNISSQHMTKMNTILLNNASTSMNSMNIINETFASRDCKRSNTGGGNGLGTRLTVYSVHGY